MAINATEVSQLLAPDMQLGNIYARQQQVDFARQQKADQDAFNFQKYIDDKYNLGTGTPFDEVTNESIRNANAALFEASKKNPRMTQEQRFAVTAPYLQGLDVKQQAAKAIRGQLTNYMAAIEKDYPYLDRNQVEAAALKAAFRDEKGNIRRELSPEDVNAFINTVTTDPMTMRKYTNADQLGQFLPKDIDARFPANEQRFADTQIPGREVIAQVRPFMNYNPKTKDIEIASQPISVAGHDIPAVPPDVFQRTFNTPAMQIALLNTQAKLEGIPEYAALPVEDKARIAGYYTLQDVGNRLGKKAIQYDDSKWKMAMEKERLDLSRRAANRADEALALRRKQAKKAEGAERNSAFNTLIRGTATDPKTGRPMYPKDLDNLPKIRLPRSIESGNDEPVSLGQVGGSLTQREVYIPLTSKLPSGMANNPLGGDKQVILWNPKTKNTIVQNKRYNSEEKRYDVVSTQIIKPEDYGNFILQYEPQFKALEAKDRGETLDIIDVTTE